jgi:hypothetical protein
MNDKMFMRIYGQIKYLANYEDRLRYAKKYYRQNKTTIRKRQKPYLKEYGRKNRDILSLIQNMKRIYDPITYKTYQKQYRQKNGDKIKEYRKGYYELNKERSIERSKEYYKQNKQHIRELQKQYYELRKKNGTTSKNG